MTGNSCLHREVPPHKHNVPSASKINAQHSTLKGKKYSTSMVGLHIGSSNAHKPNYISVGSQSYTSKHLQTIQTCIKRALHHSNHKTHAKHNIPLHQNETSVRIIIALTNHTHKTHCAHVAHMKMCPGTVQGTDQTTRPRTHQPRQRNQCHRNPII